MNDATIRTAIVIPVYNRRETTLQALRSLARINSQGIEVRIFIVDDGSTDGTSEAVKEHFPLVDVIPGTGDLHYAAGTNWGIEAALSWSPDYVVIMNDDAVFDEQFLQRLIATARKNKRTIVGSLLLLWNEPHRVFQIALEWRTLKGGWDSPEDLTAFTVPQDPFEVECLVGNCVLIPVAAVLECGVLDEKRFPHGWGDVQYTTRMRKAGWRLLVDPRSRIWCEPNTYPRPLHDLSILDGLKKLFFDQRHPANLKRQFDARWHSAPSKAKAIASFAVYCWFIGRKSLGYGLRDISLRSR
jgi:GT2 family glycosyltransferase